MKAYLRITTILVLCTLLFTTGITSAAADSPTPVGIPDKSPSAPAPMVGKPQAVPQNSSAADSTQAATAIGLGKPQAQSPDEVSVNKTLTNTASGSVTVSSVWTTDGSGNAKTTFNPGDSIRWYGYVYNSTGATQTAYFVWSLNSPCGSNTIYSGNLSTVSGTPWWNVSGTVPSNACGGTYTYTLSVTYNGSTSSKSVGYTVNGSSSGSVTVTSAFTTDGSGNAKTSFNAGDGIRWVGSVSNTTGSAKTALFTWSLSGPCGSSTLYSNNLSTNTGVINWYVSSTVPTNCPGSYTFSISVNYNGSTTSKSASYTVNGGSSGSVTITSAYTTDGSSNAKTSFVAGDAIRWFGSVANTTGSAKTALFTWSLSGPCGSSTLYSNNLSTGTGVINWYVSNYVPTNCPGSYTIAVSVNYNGSTTSKSAGYSVTNPSGTCNTSCQNQLNQNVTLRQTNGQTITVQARNMDGTLPVAVLYNNTGYPGPFPFGLYPMPSTPFTSDTSNRYGDLYKAVIFQFGVNVNYRYLQIGSNYYCNTFAGDVARAMGNPFPSKKEYGVLSPPNDPTTINAHDLYTWFTTISSDPNKSSSARGWRQISDLQQIISAVSAGKIVVAVQDGHIAVVRPDQKAGVTSLSGLRTAQAGLHNLVDTTIGDQFNQAYKFFIHD